MDQLLHPIQTEDHAFMLQAMELAYLAEKQNEVPIGALLVQNNLIIGKGFNQSISQHDPTAHAEIMALRSGARYLNNYRLPKTTLYVTLEPCAMCVGALIHARVERIVYGALDPKSGALGGAFHLLELAHFNHYPKITPEIENHSCGKILQEFFKKKRIK